MREEWINDLRCAYDAKADERDAKTIEPWKAEERERFLSVLLAEGKTRLLEIGSGPGRDGRFFQDRGLSVVCVDLSPRMVALCRAKGLDAREMDIMDLDFPPASFDAMFALNSLLHVPSASLPEVLQSIRRLLRPAGLFYLGVYGGVETEGPFAGDPYLPPRFFSFHSDDRMREIVSRDFDLVSFRTVQVETRGAFHFQSILLRS